MTFTVAVTGAAQRAADHTVPQLVSDLVASRITAQDADLWGDAARTEAEQRLGWTEAVAVSRGMVDDILALRDRLRDSGVDHIVLCGMGGSSLAPEVMARTAGAPLTVLDATAPTQVARALRSELSRTAVVIASKSGTTMETDSHRRVFEKAYRDAGIDPVERIIVVTDPGTPLDEAARREGHRVFNADPTVGGRYSALTAFGLVPTGLAGVDISAILDEASAVAGRLAIDHPDNPALVLGAALAATRPLRDTLVIVEDGTHIVGLGDWIEQLVAESTGKDGRGILPVVATPDSPELDLRQDDVQIVRLVASERETREVIDGEIEISGTLGAHLLVWQYATAVAGRLLGINPFDQPDVESAKTATRGLLDERPAPSAPAFTEGTISVRVAGGLVASDTLEATLETLLAQVTDSGYISVQAYLDRTAHPQLATVRDSLARRTGRPTTFGWGPRFLHSTGQYHKGGPADGVFLQLVDHGPEDVRIPGRPFSFGDLLRAQAAGDASVLAQHGRPVLTLDLASPGHDITRIRELLRR